MRIAEYRKLSAPSESQIQTRYFDVLRANEAKHSCLRWIFAVPNGGHRHIAVASRMRAEGVRAGIWDVHIPFPTPHAPGAFIEFKKDKSCKLTPHQVAFFDEVLFPHGYAFAVCYSVSSAIEFTASYLGIDLK